MGEEHEVFTAGISGAGESPETTTTTVTAADEGGAGNVGGEGKANPDGDGHGGKNGPEYTRAFKERVDRIRATERRRFESELKKRDDEWNRKFEELKKSFGSPAKPKALKREDFGSDEEFAEARRNAAIDEIVNRIEERNNARTEKDRKEREQASEAEEAQRKFAVKFSEGMKRTLTPEQQQKVVSIVNDEYSAVNSFVGAPEGQTLQKWLFDDCTIPADVLLFLEEHSDKLSALANLSPRRQVEQLDILERCLAKAYAEAAKKGQNGGEGAGNNSGKRTPPVMGQFGGSRQTVVDESKLSDQERVSRLIKAMRKR